MTVMPHWSASRFMLWDQCPGLFKARYVDGEAFQITEAVAFGQAVHQGLEAHFNDQDGIRAFRSAWKQSAVELGEVDPSLTARGMDLLDQVFDLNLAGTPERGFSLDTNAELGAPIVGAIDLWGNDGVIYDFKTTRGLWSQQRAQQEVWQPVLYSMARWEQEPDFGGAFEYIVLNRVTGSLQRLRREWSADELVVQMDAAWNQMRYVATCVAADVYACHGKHGFCPECGDRWSHEHVCAVSTERIRLHVQ